MIADGNDRTCWRQPHVQDKSRKEGVDIISDSNTCWCYEFETMDMDKHTITELGI